MLTTCIYCGKTAPIEQFVREHEVGWVHCACRAEMIRFRRMRVEDLAEQRARQPDLVFRVRGGAKGSG